MSRFTAALALAGCAALFAFGNAAFAQFNPVTFTATQTTVTLDWSTSPSGMRPNSLAVNIWRIDGPVDPATACPDFSDAAKNGYTLVTRYDPDIANGIPTRYTDMGRTAETRYCYRIAEVAFNRNPSNAVDVTTAAEPRPVASVAAAMIRVTPGAAVTLTGSGTGQSAISNYAWTCSLNSPTGVTGIAAPTLASNGASNAGDATPAATFTAQMLVDGDGMPFMHSVDGAMVPVTEIVLHCDLVVTSGGGESNPARTVVTIANVPPTVSVATAAITVAPEAEVTLSGSGTGDPAPTFAWTCPTVTVNAGATLSAPTIALMNAAGTAAYAMGANAQIATFTAPALTDPDDATKTAAAITVTCTLTVTSGGVPVTADTVVTIAVAGGAADEAVLPNVLRNITHGINSGIFNRIQQRQQQDGRWK